MQKDKVLRTVLYLSAILSLAVFIIPKNKGLMRLATSGTDSSGDLYRMAKVRDFVAPVPADVETSDEDTGRAAESSIIAIGDSFFSVSRGCPRFTTQLGRATETPIFLVNPGTYEQPFEAMTRLYDRNGRAKMVLIESVERYLEMRFARPIDSHPSVAQTKRLVQGKDLDSWYTTDERYMFLLKNNVATRPTYEALNTAAFHWFGKISSSTPVYSLNPPFLFYEEETGLRAERPSLYAQHSDELVQRMASNISNMRDELRSLYGLDMVFMPIPNKLTIYGKFVDATPPLRRLHATASRCTGAPRRKDHSPLRGIPCLARTLVLCERYPLELSRHGYSSAASENSIVTATGALPQSNGAGTFCYGFLFRAEAATHLNETARGGTLRPPSVGCQERVRPVLGTPPTVAEAPPLVMEPPSETAIEPATGLRRHWAEWQSSGSDAARHYD